MVWFMFACCGRLSDVHNSFGIQSKKRRRRRPNLVGELLTLECCLNRIAPIPIELRQIITSYLYAIRYFDNTTIREAVVVWCNNRDRVREVVGIADDVALYYGPIHDWDISHVTDMRSLFEDQVEFNDNIDSWDVSNVTNMSYMFYGASTFNQPLNQWNVCSVTDMNHMFYQAVRFNQPLDQWNVSNVKNMSSMFHMAMSFNQSVRTWNYTTTAIYTTGMFAGAIEYHMRTDDLRYCFKHT